MKHFYVPGHGSAPCGAVIGGDDEFTTKPAGVTCVACGLYAELYEQFRLDTLMMQRLVSLLNTPVHGFVVGRDVIRADIEAAVEALVNGGGK